LSSLNEIELWLQFREIGHQISGLVGFLPVFLTSITGFLGSQILRCLLEHPEIKYVIGLVRAIWTVPVQAGVCSSLQSKLRRDLDTQVATNGLVRRLRCLLEHPEIKYVIGLVRAKDEEQARRKVQQHGCHRRALLRLLKRGGPIWTVPVQAGVCSSLQSKLRRDLDIGGNLSIKIASKLGLET
jgi:hypothetical protein